MLASICQDSVCHYVDVRFKGHGVIETLHTRKFYGTYDGRILELDFYPMRFSFFGRWKSHIRFLFLHQFTPREIAVSFHLCPFQWLAGVSFRSRESQYSYVLIIPPFFRVRLRYREMGLYFLPLHIHAAIDDGSHGIFRLDPWSAGHGPSRAVLHRETESQSFAFFGGVLYCSIPIFT